MAYVILILGGKLMWLWDRFNRNCESPMWRVLYILAPILGFVFVWVTR